MWARPVSTLGTGHCNGACGSYTITRSQELLRGGYCRASYNPWRAFHSCRSKLQGPCRRHMSCKSNPEEPSPTSSTQASESSPKAPDTAPTASSSSPSPTASPSPPPRPSSPPLSSLLDSSSPSTSSTTPEEPSNAAKILSEAQRIAGEDREDLQISKEVIERLKYTVFGFDTFWVTSVDNYEGGVIFKGNLRGRDFATSYAKMKQRLKNELGDKYMLYVLEDKDGVPTAILLPAEELEGSPLAQDIRNVAEVWLCGLFAIATAVTTIQSNGAPLFQFLVDPELAPLTADDITAALPGTVLFWFILGAHEFGHIMAARKHDVKLTFPFFVPGGFGLLGSFGGLIRFKNVVPNREALLDISVAGPAMGSSVCLVLLLVGFLLTSTGNGSVGIDTPLFADSLLMGLLAQAFIPDQLAQSVVDVHPLLLAGWAGLVVNALACIPVGDLDGARITQGLWGRSPSALINNLTYLVLGLSALFRTLALYWFALVAFLARGPILPQAEEYSEPKSETNKLLGPILLSLPLLVLLPFPVELAAAIANMQNPAPVF